MKDALIVFHFSVTADLRWLSSKKSNILKNTRKFNLSLKLGVAFL